MTKIVLLFLISFFSLDSFAWTKVIQCEDGAFHIDKRCELTGSFPQSYQCQYQIVINRYDINNYLFSLNQDKLTLQVFSERGYGNFKGHFDYMPKVEIRNVYNGDLKLETYRFGTRGSVGKDKNWIFKNCKLVQEY